MDKEQVQILICSVISSAITWYLNHVIGFENIVANGLVGVLTAILLPGPLAAATYTASFVGMSGTAVITSVFGAAVGGIIVGTIWILTSEVYAGIGGKGGTTACLSVHITRAIMKLFS